MLNLKMLQNTIMYQNRPFDPGPMKVKSNISQQKEDIDDTVFLLEKKLVPIMIPEKKSSTLVFHQGNKKEILVDRLSIYNPDIQITGLFPILEAESISNEKDSKGFWKESLKELSRKLWLPKETAFHDLDLSYLNGFSKSTMQSSFQIKQMTKKHPNMNYQKTLWPSSLFSAPNTMVEENIRYCRKIRIYPYETQKDFFNQCFRATRFIHNNALEYIQKNPNTSKSHISLRKDTMLSDKQLSLDENNHLSWLKDIPYDTRQLVLKQLASNFKTNFTLLKRKHITHFKMSFKSIKSPYQSFFINKKALNLSTLRLFPRRLKKSVRVRKRLEKWIEKNVTEGDCIIRREKNRYYLCIPMIKKNTIIPSQSYNTVALDPGVRTFQTFYSDQGIAGKIGDSLCDELIDIGIREDKLKSILKTTKTKRTRYNLKKRCFLLRSKIKNIVNDLHWKTAHFLCSTFKRILLPLFDVSNMIQKGLPEKARKINSKTVRKMLFLSPYAFKEKLLFKARSWGCQVDIVDESYTTKACGWCGSLKEMGGSKIYKCSHCNFVLDRDYNGSRNILLKNIFPG